MKRVVWVLKITVAALLLIWLAKAGRLDVGILKSVSAHWPWFIGAQIVFGGVQLMTAVRWRWLLGVVNVQCTFRRAFQLTLSGLLFNQVLLGSTGGDVYRVVAFKTSRPGERTAVVISVVADRIVGLFALMVLIPIGAVWNYSMIRQSASLSAAAVGASMLAIMGPLILFAFLRASGRWKKPLSNDNPQSRLARWRAHADEWLALFYSKPGIIVQSLLISLVIQALIVTVNVFLAFSILGVDIVWETFYFLIPIALLGMALPINPPGALGTGEAMYVYLLDFAGIVQGGMISILQRITNILWALLGSLAFLMPLRGEAAKQKDEAESSER